MRQKKLKRDRKAGLHFHWHLPHGSLGRTLVALLIATLFWGVLLAYVEIRPLTPTPLPERAADLEIIDLDSPANGRLADYIDRNSPFLSRWEVRSPENLKREISRALAVNSLRDYRVSLEPVEIPEAPEPLRGIPGWGIDRLPVPEKVTIEPGERPASEWWIMIEKTSGEGEWDGLSFRWNGEAQDLSAGETWTYQIGLDWRGRLISSLPLKGRREAASRQVHEALRVATFPQLGEDEAIRWWMLQAHAVDRSPR
jgi:hypothetical protein